MAAQKALRESVGRHEPAQMTTDPKAPGDGLQRTLGEKRHPWGVAIQSAEVRDGQISRALAEGLFREAQAERERQARIIFGQAESEVARRFVNVPNVYENQPLGLHLRR